ncbi:MAG: hypothetical protein KIT27_02860 [Legionellales bacterium]|nr:hypothetical protein [Legionellales bacterium]
MSGYLLPILIMTSVVLLLLILFMVFLQSRNSKKRMSAMNSMVNKVSADKESRHKSVMEILNKTNLSEETIASIGNLYRENEKIIYSAIVDGITGNNYQSLENIEPTLLKLLSTCCEFMTVEVKPAAEKPALLETPQQEAKEPDAATPAENKPEEDVEEVFDEIADVSQDEEAISENNQPAEAEGNIETELSVPETIAPISENVDNKDETLESLRNQINQLMAEKDDLTKNERMTRELLDTVLGEFGAMFNITRETVATMSLDEIRDLISGDKT